MDTDTAPDWITPGTPVLVYREKRGVRELTARESTIATVGAKTFTVDGERKGERPARFDLDDQKHRGGTAFDPPTVVVPLDSDRARAVLAEVARRRSETTVRDAFDTWNKGRTLANLDDLAAAVARHRALIGDES